MLFRYWRVKTILYKTCAFQAHAQFQALSVLCVLWTSAGQQQKNMDFEWFGYGMVCHSYVAPTIPKLNPLKSKLQNVQYWYGFGI